MKKDSRNQKSKLMPSIRTVRRPQRLGEEALAQVNGGLSGWPEPQPTGPRRQFTLTALTYQQQTATYT